MRSVRVIYSYNINNAVNLRKIRIATAWKMQNDVISCFPALSFETSVGRKFNRCFCRVYPGDCHYGTNRLAVYANASASCYEQTLMVKLGELSRNLLKMANYHI